MPGGEGPARGEAAAGALHANWRRWNRSSSSSGPATFLNEAVVQIDAQLRRLARKRAAGAAAANFCSQVATRYGITSAPSIDNAEFVATVVFDLGRAARHAEGAARLPLPQRPLGPDRHPAAARPERSPNATGRSSLIEAAVHETTSAQGLCRRRQAGALLRAQGRHATSSPGPRSWSTGSPAPSKDALLVLFAVAAGGDGVDPARSSSAPACACCPLGIALAAAAITFGLFGLARRLADDGLDRRPPDPDRPRRRLRDPVPGPLRRGGRRPAHSAASTRLGRPPLPAGPTIATACLATAAGFLALLLSPTPMVRSFGLLLVAGVADRLRPLPDRRLRSAEPAAKRRGASGTLRGWRRGRCRERRRTLRPQVPPRSRVRSRLPELLSLPLARRRVLGVGLALAVIGWGVGTQIETRLRHPSLAPQNLARGEGPERPAGRDRRLRRARRQRRSSRPRPTPRRSSGWPASSSGSCATTASPGRPELPGGGNLPGPGALGLPHRRRPASCGAGERPGDARGELSPYALRQVAPVDPKTGMLGHAGADQLRHPGPVAGGPAGADRPGPRRDR